MRLVRTGALIGVATTGFAAAAVIIVNCASATTITLDVRTTTDACSTVTETGIAVTTPDDQKTGKLQDTQAGCHKASNWGEIGTLVVTPNGDKTAKIGVRVVAGLNGKSAALCDTDDGVVHDNCIIALRTVSFVEGANVPLVIPLDPVCAAQSCPNMFTCTGVNGKPVCTGIPSASKPDPEPGDGGSSGNPVPMEAAPDLDTSYKDTYVPPDGNPCNDCTGTGRTCVDNKCTVNCATPGANCSGNNVCLNSALECTLQCDGQNVCNNANCLGSKKCSFECGGNNGDNHCNNIACDAATCVVDCKDQPLTCQKVLVTGTTNTITCAEAPGQKATCDQVRCVPGQKPGTVCSRTCTLDDAGGCGLISECDAGKCDAFQVNDGGAQAL